MSWNLVLPTVSIVLLTLVLINLYFRGKTFKSMSRELDREKWQRLSKDRYVKNCYNFVADHFGHMKHCYFYRPWRNFYYGDVWKQKRKGMPCHILNSLFQHCLLRRLGKKEVKTAVTTNPVKLQIIHFFTRVKLKGKWVDVDAWGKKRGIPFGKSINDLR